MGFFISERAKRFACASEEMKKTTSERSERRLEMFRPPISGSAQLILRDGRQGSEPSVSLEHTKISAPNPCLYDYFCSFVLYIGIFAPISIRNIY